jgi:hypothetical protein
MRSRVWSATGTRAALFAGLTGAVALMALGGLANGKLKEKSTTFTVSGLVEPSDGAVTCRQGREAVSGGFFADPAEIGTPLIFDSLREGRRTWSFELYGGTKGEATAYAYCDKREPGLKAKEATDELAENFVTQSVTATCKRGQEAVSGGFDAPFTELSAVGSKRSGKRTWEAQFVGPAGAEVTAIAYCDKKEPGLKTKQATTTVAESGTESVTAKCKRKQELRSGGFEAEFDFAADIQGLAYGSRRQGKRRWEASGLSTDGSPEIAVYAYCDKKEKK